MDIKAILDEKIEYWKAKLLDLTARNRLISFKETKTTLRFTNNDINLIYNDLIDLKKIYFSRPETLDNSKKVDINEETDSEPLERFNKGEEYAARLKRKWGISKPDLSSSAYDEDETKESVISKSDLLSSAYGKDETEKRLYRIYLKTKEGLREKGINTLFVVFGILKYFKSRDSDQELSAPLLLVPVEIGRLGLFKKDRHDFFIELLDEDIQLNPAIKQKLLKDFNVELPEFNDTDTNTFLHEIEKIVEEEPRWRISNEICLGIFSFQKLVMYLDIERLREKIYSNVILRVLEGDETALSSLKDGLSDVSTGEELDKLKPDNIFQVLDADSSQQEAIETAKRGISFVIQGPPGTGKSQTIANIIAELLSQKKRILFVSEKMAALSVVKKRLDKVNLGRYCLELHRSRANKKDVLHSLNVELREKRTPKKEDENLIREYEDCREELNAHGREILKNRGEVKYSIYTARGSLAKLINIPEIPIKITDSMICSREKFDSRLAKLRILEGFRYEMSTYYTNPWRYTSLTSYDLQTNQKLRDLLANLRQNIFQLKKLSEDISELIDIIPETPDQFNKIEKFVSLLASQPKGLEVRNEWYTKNLTEDLQKINEIIENLKDIEKKRTILLQCFDSSFLKIDAEALLEKFSTEFRSTLRFFKMDYWKTKSFIKGHSKLKKPMRHIEQNLTVLILFKKTVEKTEDLISKLDPFLRESVEKGIVTWDLILETLNWIKSLRQIEENIPDKIIQKLHNNFDFKPILDSIGKTYSKDFKTNFCEFLQFFKDDIELGDQRPEANTIGSISNWLSLLERDFSKIRIFIEFRNKLSQLDKDIQNFVYEFLRNNNDSSLLVKTYKKRFFFDFLNEADNDITKQAGYYLSDRRDIFRRLDEDQLPLSQMRLIKLLESTKPSSSSLENTSSSEIAILKREIKKRRRHKALRILFPQISNLLFNLKPCFMMSPLSVSQYINPDEIPLFDTVIFDEASQIMPEDAVSCLIRAKQAIVVGDSEQLPPTTFFLESYEDLVEEELEDLESILDNCSYRLPEKYLRWHYRSKDESLIAFSNKEFYESRLVTFPNSEEVAFRGIDFIYVENAVYDRGRSKKNPKEAKKVVELIKEHIEKTPDKSLGVVAFNLAQQEEILDELELFKKNNPQYIGFFYDDVLDEFFVKNLENVQGDERDIIILDIGYGKDSQGKLSLNFGPINKAGGYRRLNVAITRAREKVKIVSSMQPDEIDDSKTMNRGVRILKKYLEYAKYGAKVLEMDLEIPETLAFGSSFEEAVYDSLVSRDWIVESQVGCSGYRIDLAVKHPVKKGKFILGIECDGNAYHSSRTARDRDRLRQDILENLGWSIHRIWSSDWLFDSNAEIEKIENKLNKLIQNGSNESTKEESNNRFQFEETIEENIRSIEYSSYEITNLYKKGNFIDFNKMSPSELVNDIVSIVQKESPIHQDLIMRRIADSWSISKIGRRVREKLLFAIKSAFHDTLYNKGLKSKNQILWSTNPGVLSPVRKSTEEQRPFTLIPPSELGQLITDLLEQAFSIEEKDLMIEVAKSYNYHRTGRKIREHIKRTIKYLEKNKLMRREGERITKAD